MSIPSLYKIFKGSDWQERETYDMYGINFIDHPNPKRLLMPEDWRGWPLRKDYIQPTSMNCKTLISLIFLIFGI